MADGMGGKALHKTDAGTERAPRHTKYMGIRAVLAGLALLVAGVAGGLYVAVHWAEHQVLTTDNWVATVSPLPKQPVVASALGDSVSKQLFDAVPIKAEVADALPPKAAFLAGPLTDQLQAVTSRAARAVVASDGFQTLWEGANRVAMNRVVSVARGQTPPGQAKLNEKFNVDLSGVKGQLNSALGDVGKAIPALQPAAHQALAVSADLQARPRRVQKIIRLIDYLAVVLPWVIAAGLLTAVALAKNRWRMFVTMVFLVVALLLVELIAIKILRQRVLGAVRDSANTAAVSYVYDALTQQLRELIYWAIFSMIVLAGILILAGPAAWARRLRDRLYMNRLKTSRFYEAWLRVRGWIGRWEWYLWAGTGGVALVSLALAETVSVRTVIIAVLAAVCVGAGLHIVALRPAAGMDKA